jgi:hypothetical protein
MNQAIAGWRRPAIVLVLGCTLAAARTALAEDPWADAVVAYHAINPNPGFDTPEKALGEPVGGGTVSPGNTSLHSIGTPGPAPGSYLTLKFNTPVTDDPSNPFGLDCIVYGNAMWVGGNPQRKLVEAGLIEISADANGNGLADDPWFVIPGSRALSAAILPEGIANPSPALAGNVLNPATGGVEYDWGYADLNPTQRKYLDNYVRPDDPRTTGLTARSGGGDAFDIAWAVDAQGQPAGLAQFDFIRVSTIVAGYTASFGYITTEIDAVADVAPAVDMDGDGILDEYETRVAGTDPARPESTVLALEIPPEDGGSPAGALLGEAADSDGNALRLYSSGQRTGVRNYNLVADIEAAADPGGTIPGLTKSSAVRSFQSSEPDFAAAQVQDGEFVLAYTAADIAGLDELGLQPYRFDGAAYTQDGLHSIVRDSENNRITFRSQYPGTFVLASTPGSGDTSIAPGSVTLDAQPASATVGNPGGTIVITGSPVSLTGGAPAPDGTVFTVAATLGEILTPDADGVTPGIQVLTSGGTLTFALQAGTLAGIAQVTAHAVSDNINGQTTCVFLAGPPESPTDLWLINPDAVAPGPILLGTDLITDAFGNDLPEHTLVTVAVEGGSVETLDADSTAPGHQHALQRGMADFSVRAHTERGQELAIVTVSVYADPARTTLLATGTWSFNVVVMPLRIALLLTGALIGAVFLVFRRYRVKPIRVGGQAGEQVLSRLGRPPGRPRRDMAATKGDRYGRTLTPPLSPREREYEGTFEAH